MLLPSMYLLLKRGGDEGRIGMLGGSGTGVWFAWLTVVTLVVFFA